MNIYDISKKAGVSIATVSRVLNESSHVSEKTRDKVLAVIKAENYSPSGASRSLSIPRTVGILYSDASDLYLANAIYHWNGNCAKTDMLLSSAAAAMRQTAGKSS